MTIPLKGKAKLSELHAAAVGGKFGAPRFPRLQFNPEDPYFSTRTNEDALCDFADYLLSLGESNWITNPDLFEASSDDVVVATVERYGLPLRTVYSLRTGLMRSDPYYRPKVADHFYRKFYRSIYDAADTLYSAKSRSNFLAGQVSKGAHFYDVLQREGVEFKSVLDYGCGMGGTLIPFKQAGARCVGCDLGEDYLIDGKHLGLDVVHGGIEAVRDFAPFDLVMVCHVLEHLPNAREFLASIHSLLSENGAILVEVPGIRVIPTWYQGDILRYLQNAHVWHFTRSTLNRLMVDTGFMPVYADDLVLFIGRKLAVNSRSETVYDPQAGLRFLDQTERAFASQKSLLNRARGHIWRFAKALARPKKYGS